MSPRSHLVPIVVFALLFASACEGTAERLLSDSGTCTNPSGCPGGQDGGVDGSIQFDAGGRRIERLAVTPAVVTLGSTASSPMPSQQFTAELVLEDASRRSVQFVNWSLSGPRVGTVDASGLFVANGVSGGRATLTASVNVNGTVFTAPAAVVVQLERTMVGTGFDTADIVKFDGPAVTGRTGTPSVLYPLDGVVMPLNVAPADIQWDVGARGDLIRVRIEKPNAAVTGYFRVVPGFGNHWLVDADMWRTVATSDGEAPAMVTVDRYVSSSDTLFRSATVGMTFANAILAGTQYYWNLGTLSVRQIDDGATTSTSLIPRPTPGLPCMGCHAVSTSGRYMSAGLGSVRQHLAAGVYDLTSDLTVQSPAPVYPFTMPGFPQWQLSSWNPDDTRMVILSNALQLSVVDPFTGDTVPITGELPGGDVHNPRWAPDNSAILYVDNVSIDVAPNQVAGDLTLLPITGPDAVGRPRMIHEGASLEGNPAGASDNFPSWSPDSQRIAFTHGNGSVSTRASAALYIINRDGTNLVRLDRANGASLRNFQPNFSPFDEGGYHWVTFLSLRPYGNPVVGSAGNVQQVWVAAIRKDAAPGEDPSVVAYWLPGQSAKSRNISVQWAPQACRSNGEACTLNRECCTERCNTAGVCEAPPEIDCRERGFTCAENDDCCGALVCRARACSEPLI